MTTGPASTKTAALPSIDGMRAVAVLLVVLAHAANTPGFPLPGGVAALGDLGNLGVRLFFVVSGFLITYLLLTEQAATGRISLKKFYLRRSLRIFPAFYVFLLVMAIATIAGAVEIPLRDFVLSAAYMMNFQEVRSWYLGHTWSLGVEEQFYLLWPGIFVLAATRRLSVVAGVILVTPVIRIIMAVAIPESMGLIGEAFYSVADAIASGAALALLRPRLHAWAPYQRALASPLFIPVIILVFGINALGPDFTVFKWLVGWTLLNMGIAFVLDRVITFPADLLGRSLNSAPASTLGKLSYSIYLWQQPFLYRHGFASWANFPVNVILAGCAAVASYRLVELPALRLKDRIGHSFGRRSG